MEQPETLQEARRRYGLPNEYLLAVGTIEPRKNLSTLLDAFLAVKAQTGRRDLRLVIVGKKGWLFQGSSGGWRSWGWTMGGRWCFRVRCRRGPACPLCGRRVFRVSLHL